MNNEKELKSANEYIALWEKYYFEIGDKEKGKEYLNKAMELQDESWEINKKEIVKIMQKAGLPTEDLIKELENIK